MQNLVKNVKPTRKNNNKQLTKSKQRKTLTKGETGLAASIGARRDSSDGVNPIISKGKKTKKKSPRSNTRSSDATKRKTRAAEKNQIWEKNILFHKRQLNDNGKINGSMKRGSGKRKVFQNGHQKNSYQHPSDNSEEDEDEDDNDAEGDDQNQDGGGLGGRGWI